MLGLRLPNKLFERFVQVFGLSVDVFVFLSCVFRKFLVILVGVAGLYRAFLRAFLEDFVFKVADARELFLVRGAKGGSHRRRER